MKTAVEIYKLLPKTNCGACGTPTCFGFAAKVAAKLSTASGCPYLGREALEMLHTEQESGQNSPGTVYEQALISLKPKVKGLDFRKTASLFKADYIGPEELRLKFLGRQYRVTKEKVMDPSGEEARPWVSILIYNHITMPDPPAPSGEWITFSSIPASHAKDKAWVGHVEAVIAQRFSGNVPDLEKACERLDGWKAEIKGSHDAAYEFRFFPIYPALLFFHDAVPEEGFPAQCRLLLDKNVPHYLDIESIVVLGEEFAARLTGS